MLRTMIVSLALLTATAAPLAGCGSDSLSDSPHDNRSSSPWQPAAEAWHLPAAELPLGPSALPEARTTTQLTRGLTYYHIARGQTASTDFWTVTVEFAATQSAAAPAAAAMAAAGYQVRYDSAGFAPDGSALGFNVSIGQYAIQADAQAVALAIAKATGRKYRPTVRNTGTDGNATSTGPWLVNILAVSPTFKGNLQNVIAGGNETDVGGMLGVGGETPQATAARLGGIAAINAGFWSTNAGATGVELKGAASTIVSNGKLEGMAANGEAGVSFTQVNGQPSVVFLPNLSTTVTLANAAGASTQIVGVNRSILGQIYNCGSPGALPASGRAHDYTCTNYDDLVLYDGNFNGGRTSSVTVDAGYSGLTYAMLVDSAGQVVSGSAVLGAAPPQGGYVLQGLGTSATWLQQNATPGTMLNITPRVQSNDTAVTLSPGMSLAAAGPILLPAATVRQRAVAQGWSPNYAGVDRSGFYWGWFNARSPRTMIGKAPDGTILMVEVDGRQPGLALGTTIQETADVMQWLGAISAVNLDGGGSSAMIVNGANVGHPSDNWPSNPTQRAVASSLVLIAN
ncbi:phosphodiester glycosidase family protein [Paraburkholderia agricolaris]|uniref:phosphodiester glycosidase family protein n=1 Tax=Paraburkholderia agricolaris TaxID=2152888 RepID=UPI001C2C427E|nr:phosphodiester glycosidase family protein [Paraburkholderia agricolaris]